MTPSSLALSRAAASSSPPASARGRIHPRIALDHLGRRRVEVRYESHGRLAPVRRHPGASSVRSPPAPTVVLGGISAGRHLAPAPFDPSPGWWPGLVGPGEALDPARRPLIGVDYLGGAGLRPVTTRDQARAVAAVLDHLGIGTASLVGASYGGMVALAFAELFPARIGRLVVVCAAHRTHPMATAVRSVQRAAVSLGADAGDPARGLALARALAMTTYRSAREFEERFSPFAAAADLPHAHGAAFGDVRGAVADRGPGVPSTAARDVPPAAGPARFPVEEYLEARGAAFARTFDPERFAALSESIDLHRTRPGSLPADALLVSFDSDALVPPRLIEELAAREGRSPARHLTIPSPYGHDAFLKETETVSGCVRGELGGEGVAR